MRISDWSSDVCSSDLKFKLFRRLEPFHFDPRSRRFQIDRLLEFVASMNTDRLPAIVLRDRDSIANGIVLVDANAVLALDRHIGLVIAAATEKIIPNAQIFAFELRGQSKACAVNLLVILWRCLRWNLSFRGRSTVFEIGRAHV